MLRLFLVAPLLLITACTSPNPGRDEEAHEAAANGFNPPQPRNVPPPALARAVARTTTGGDGSPIRLGELEDGDTRGLEGELACSFGEYKGALPLLIGRADVGKDARAQAVVRNGDVPERLVATSGGGFGALEKGVTFGGKGLTVKLETQSKLETGNESTSTSAVLLVKRADGAERRYQGLWTCGP